MAPQTAPNSVNGPNTEVKTERSSPPSSVKKPGPANADTPSPYRIVEDLACYVLALALSTYVGGLAYIAALIKASAQPLVFITCLVLVIPCAALIFLNMKLKSMITKNFKEALKLAANGDAKLNPAFEPPKALITDLKRRLYWIWIAPPAAALTSLLFLLPGTADDAQIQGHPESVGFVLTFAISGLASLVVTLLQANSFFEKYLNLAARDSTAAPTATDEVLNGSTGATTVPPQKTDITEGVTDHVAIPNETDTDSPIASVATPTSMTNVSAAADAALAEHLANSGGTATPTDTPAITDPVTPVDASVNAPAPTNPAIASEVTEAVIAVFSNMLRKAMQEGQQTQTAGNN